MLKLLAMLMAFLLVALVLLGLRQRRLELTSESSAIYSQIREQNEKLLDLKVVIARQTNPHALADALQNAGMDNGGTLLRRVPANSRSTPAVETDLTAPIR
jgi:cell division protein FtsL